MQEIAQRHGVSVEAVTTLLQALLVGNGRSAQFTHPELGGTGQWMLGGMTMVGDMFNNALKARVDSLCSELSGLLASQPSFLAATSSQSQSQYQGGGQQPGSSGGSFAEGGGVSLFVPGTGGSFDTWWPQGLGSPSASGAQNNIRYAYFAGPRRLAVDLGGKVTLYDTQDYHISGVSQQQSQGATVTFTSQKGLVAVSELPVVQEEGTPPSAAGQDRQATTAAVDVPRAAPADTADTATEPSSAVATAVPPPRQEDVFDKIERLAALKDKGILSEDEFKAKKTELLSRL